VADRIIVIGGGASGLMAAGRAAQVGARVLLLEKKAHPGIKLSLTGNGRGNLTHAASVASFCEHLGQNGRFARNVLERFTYHDARRFWAERGLPTVCERDGRVFPRSGDASDVVAALSGYCRQGRVAIRTGAEVSGVRVANGAVRKVVLADGSCEEAAAVVLATGGMTYPHTGSTGDGHRMAQELGHVVSPCVGGLVPLVIADGWARRLQGRRVSEVRTDLLRDGREVASARGDLLFTHFGVSGPTILSLSLAGSRELESGPLLLRVDFVPEMTLDSLDRDLAEYGAANGRWRVLRLVSRFVPRALAGLLIEKAGLPADLSLSQMSGMARRALVGLLKRFDMNVVGKRPMREAMITVGGLNVGEIDPRMMGSRLIRGLYIVGELVDIAGDTGGYNLHFAFASGYVAGESAAGYLMGTVPGRDAEQVA